ncbi:putative nucleotide-diphospho-sugar transferase [Oceanobacter antarcticus]|jgi:hypothetical protein|uniref:Nucleotide-diphospho-sugar transferase n=1 Tax=Oceanobacter antarcticus TaxID=3133425 RepID=A0ABW8NFH8_9GAMM|tara:strand:- start:206 stop:1087 length:882 start_codon:yes stop_codon:yes gene_type:complete
MTQQDNAKRGFVYAATGSAVYTELAIRSAHSLKEQCPDLPIDLFTDKPVEDSIFDKVYILGNSWFRAKIDALKNSRFDESIFIDSDTLIVGNLADAFFLLKKNDIALVHDQGRNSRQGRSSLDICFPESFPALNSGVIALRKNAKTDKLLTNWKNRIQEKQQQKDQPALRELLWQSDLALAILPPEYNMMHLHLLDVFSYKQGIPKVIHSPKLHRHQNGSDSPITSLLELLGPSRLLRFQYQRHLAGAPVLPPWLLYGNAPIQWKIKLQRTLIQAVLALKTRNSTPADWLQNT